MIIRCISFFGFDKVAFSLIKKHYNINSNQIMILIWFKGLWTGLLISIVIHNILNH